MRFLGVAFALFGAVLGASILHNGWRMAEMAEESRGKLGLQVGQLEGAINRVPLVGAVADLILGATAIWYLRPDVAFITVALVTVALLCAVNQWGSPGREGAIEAETTDGPSPDTEAPDPRREDPARAHMKANIGSILVNFGVCGATCGGIVAHALASPSRLATWWFLLLLAAGNGIACWRFYESINARPASRELVGGAWAVGAAMSLLVIWRRQWTGVETHVLLSMSMTCLVVGIVCFAAAGLKLKAGRP